LVAKVDSAAVQDGFDLYLHGFILADDGSWTIVQQGMNGASRLARRYHWLSEGLESFVDDPHAAVEGRDRGRIVNLADHRAARSRQTQLDLLSSTPPDALTLEYENSKRRSGRLRKAPRRSSPIWCCPRIMMCGRKTSTTSACMPPWPQRRIGDPSISPNCC
jgi:hypothetical protein